MTQKDKDLLLKDLSARLPYHPVLHIDTKENYEDEYLYGFRENGGKFLINDAYYVEEVKPYLHPMSSMTEEEENEYAFLLNDGGWGVSERLITQCLDWLNAHHFDYRSLIDKGLAIEVTEDNNPYKE